jgi:hypothetical protein
MNHADPNRFDDEHLKNGIRRKTQSPHCQFLTSAHGVMRLCDLCKELVNRSMWCIKAW